MVKYLLAQLLIISLISGCANQYIKDHSEAPLFSKEKVEVVANLSKPPGNIAVSNDHRIFFTFHPEADPEIKVAELVEGHVRPFPDAEFQEERDNLPFFDTVLSLRVDSNNRLWTLDHGYFGIRQPRLLAFDIKTGEIVHQYDFSSDIAGFGSFLNDFQVDPSGKTILIADTGAPVPVIGGDPAIIVYEIEKKTARRILEDHDSVRATSNTLRVGENDFKLMGIPIHIAVDSIALSRDAEWLYYAAVNSEKLFRIQTKNLMDPDMQEEALASTVETFADKSMSDGITTDMDGNIYISDMENSAVHIIGQDRRLKTLLKDPEFRWPDGFSFGPDGWLYFTCSSLMDVIGQSASHIESQAPYQIYRFQPGSKGVPGH
ncbi:MAG: hypothetical protein JRF40_12230 [Deltaproteobacteria bacterium]|nr:hypothetical protein [Deltaproteobacteria bacterium]MBW2220238.1 hypothetical protein [Deltaproteobacteria bacterium]